MCGQVEVGEDSVDEEFGAHDEGGSTKVAHGGDHFNDGTDHAVHGGHRTKGTVGLTVKLLHLSQRKRVGVEGVGSVTG